MFSDVLAATAVTAIVELISLTILTFHSKNGQHYPPDSLEPKKLKLSLSELVVLNGNRKTDNWI